eukprot:7272875-Pyramimonas_sp.AAC.1
MTSRAAEGPSNGQSANVGSEARFVVSRSSIIRLPPASRCTGSMRRSRPGPLRLRSSQSSRSRSFTL